MKLSELINEDEKKDLAVIFMELHNAAAKEYSKAFSKVKARMWHDDGAHPIKKDALVTIREWMKSLKKRNIPIESIYKIVRPLTVLDSYPNVKPNERKMLDKEIDSIYKKYSNMWKKELKG